jgi:acyl dehydratase
VTVDPGQLADYARVCRFPLADTLPATFPHLLAFPLQTALMADRSFPLALPGLVHVRNTIEQLRPVGATEALDVEVWAERFATHRSGATVDLRASVSAGGAEVWRERSTYLARGATAPQGAPAAEVEVAVGALERVAAEWRVSDDAGRRYAKVSGDVNPIHLSGLTAKAFGFKRAIAHGMWVEARVLAALSGRLPDAVTVDVAFRKPLFLPSTVTLSTAEVGTGGWDVAVRNAKAGTEHVVGTVRPA